LGELWCYYKVRLSKPKLFQALRNDQTRWSIISPPLASGVNLTWATQFGATSTSFLKAQASNLPMKLDYVGLTNTITLTFPSQITGVYEVRYNVEGSGFTNLFPGSVYTSGQCKAFNDLYASTSGTAAGQSPTWLRHGLSAQQFQLVVHVQLQAAVGGVNNTLTIVPYTAVGVGNVLQSIIEVQEIGSMFSTSSLINNPVWVDTDDNVVKLNNF
jgi:hypothetical protein